jgi:hypothetical protein
MICLHGHTVVMACAMLAAASQAGITTSPFPGGDAGYDALTNGGLLEQGVTEGRIGNRIDTGTWETAIWRRNEAGPFLAQGQLTWQSGVPAPFTIDYNGGTQLVYTLGGETISTTQLGGTFTDIFLRTRSATLGSVLLSGMVISPSAGAAVAIPDIGSIGNGTINYLRLQTDDGTPMPAFTITGFQTLTWQANDPPINSLVNGLFLMTNVVPSPSGVAAAGLAGVVVVARRRRR